MKYFKVVDILFDEIAIDTNSTNYSSTLISKDFYADFLNCIIESSQNLNLPFDFYYDFYNKIAIIGNPYFQSLPSSKNGVFEVNAITNKSNHEGLFIREYDLIELVENLGGINFQVFNEGFYLWENIYERVRLAKHRDRPSREKSFFLFDSIENCEYYMEKHKGGGTICEVEIIETRTLFKADMNLLDSIPDDATFKQAYHYADRYWAGEVSDHPVYEYLFQGICKIKPV